MEALHHQTVAARAALSRPEMLAQIRTQDARASRKTESLRPNLAVRCAFYLSIVGLPFLHLYIPGTGERLGVQRVIQGLMFLAVLSRPKVCLRLVPVSLLWFLAYCGVRIAWGLWQAPEYSKLWWPSSFNLLQFLLPWAWFLFNVMRYPGFGLGGLWALVIGVSICALLHVAGIGVAQVDNGIEGRSGVFDLNANEIGAIYGLTFVAVVALGLFRHTRTALRLALLPLAALLAVAMAKTGSRGGTLLAALGVLILLPQTRAFAPRIKRYVALLLLAVIFAGVMHQIPTVVNRFKPVSASTAEDEPRRRMAPVLWEIFLRSPVYGSGPDRYQYELTRRALPYQAEKQYTVPSHNLALLLLVETGILGCALFAVGLGKALAAAWRARGGPLGLLPLAWLLPVTLAGLTVASELFEPIFWFVIAYALAGPALTLPARNSIKVRGHNTTPPLNYSCASP
jgi:O-antigen ligase